MLRIFQIIQVDTQNVNSVFMFLLLSIEIIIIHFQSCFYSTRSSFVQNGRVGVVSASRIVARINPLSGALLKSFFFLVIIFDEFFDEVLICFLFDTKCDP